MHVHLLTDNIAHLSQYKDQNMFNRSHVFCHNPSLQGEMNINLSHTRQTSGFSLSGCSETDYSRDVLCWEKKNKTNQNISGLDMQTVIYCRLSSLSFSPLLCSLSVSSLGGRWQVSSRQEQQPLTSSNVFYI